MKYLTGNNITKYFSIGVTEILVRVHTKKSMHKQIHWFCKTGFTRTRPALEKDVRTVDLQPWKTGKAGCNKN